MRIFVLIFFFFLILKNKKNYKEWIILKIEQKIKEKKSKINLRILIAFLI
jgi:hypothetical protein